MPRSLASSISHFSRKEIVSLFSTARRIGRLPGLDIKRAPRTSSIGRILIVISGKSGIAAHRNLIRRRIKALFYEEKLYLSPFDSIIFVKKEAMGHSYADLKGYLSGVL